jgi:hypothetical protein
MTQEPLDYHVARTLLLVTAFSTGTKGALDGLTKLAKLDFLLRYPAFLDRVLRARQLTWPAGLEPTLQERLAVESRMIRYKYGPWDDRYYPIVGILLGTRLTQPQPGRGSVTLRATEHGRAVAVRLEQDGWETIAGRSRLLKRHFDRSGTTLREMIYKELPDAIAYPSGSLIR